MSLLLSSGNAFAKLSRIRLQKHSFPTQNTKEIGMSIQTSSARQFTSAASTKSSWKLFNSQYNCKFGNATIRSFAASSDGGKVSRTNKSAVLTKLDSFHKEHDYFQFSATLKEHTARFGIDKPLISQIIPYFDEEFIGSLTNESISLLLWSFGRLGFNYKQPAEERLCYELFSKLMASPSVEFRDLTESLSGLARVGILYNGIPEVSRKRLMKHLVPSNNYTLKAREVSNILYSLQKMGCQWERDLDRKVQDKFLENIMSQENFFNLLERCLVVFSLGKLGFPFLQQDEDIRDSILSIAEKATKALALRDSNDKSPQNAFPIEFTNLFFGLGCLGMQYAQFNKEFQTCISLAVSNINLHGLNAVETAIVTTALAKMDVGWHTGLAMITRRLDDTIFNNIQYFNREELTIVLTSLVKLEMVISGTWEDDFCDAVFRAIRSHYSEHTPQKTEKEAVDDNMSLDVEWSGMTSNNNNNSSNVKSSIISNNNSNTSNSNNNNNGNNKSSGRPDTASRQHSFKAREKQEMERLKSQRNIAETIWSLGHFNLVHSDVSTQLSDTVNNTLLNTKPIVGTNIADIITGYSNLKQAKWAVLNKEFKSIFNEALSEATLFEAGKPDPVSNVLRALGKLECPWDCDKHMMIEFGLIANESHFSPAATTDIVRALVSMQTRWGELRSETRTAILATINRTAKDMTLKQHTHTMYSIAVLTFDVDEKKNNGTATNEDSTKTELTVTKEMLNSTYNALMSKPENQNTHDNVIETPNENVGLLRVNTFFEVYNAFQSTKQSIKRVLVHKQSPTTLFIDLLSSAANDVLQRESSHYRIDNDISVPGSEIFINVVVYHDEKMVALIDIDEHSEDVTADLARINKLKQVLLETNHEKVTYRRYKAVQFKTLDLPEAAEKLADIIQNIVVKKD